VDINKRFGVTLAAFAVLGILSWTTLSDQPFELLGVTISLRTVTLIVLGMFALRAGLYFLRARLEKSDDHSTAGEEITKPM
jgi:hypothetical protein